MKLAHNIADLSNPSKARQSIGSETQIGVKVWSIFGQLSGITL